MDENERVNELTINELVRYYIDRYHLPVYSSDPEMNEYDKRDFQALQKQITRIIQGIVIGGKNLWEIIRPEIESEAEARSISVEDFEKLCFPQWRDYLRGRYTFPDENGAVTFDEGALLADEERLERVYKEDQYWLGRAKKLIKGYNEALGTDTFEKYDRIQEELSSGDYVSDDEVDKAEYKMKIDAIYNIFYAGFRRDKLKLDMRDARYIPGGGGRVTKDETDAVAKKDRAECRLKSYQNYVIEKGENHK